MLNDPYDSDCDEEYNGRRRRFTAFVIYLTLILAILGAIFSYVKPLGESEPNTVTEKVK